MFLRLHMTDVPETDVCIVNSDHINVIHQTAGGSQPNPQWDEAFRSSLSDTQQLEAYDQAFPEHLVTEPGTYIGLTNGRSLRVSETIDEILAMGRMRS